MIPSPNSRNGTTEGIAATAAVHWRGCTKKTETGGKVGHILYPLDSICRSTVSIHGISTESNVCDSSFEGHSDPLVLFSLAEYGILRYRADRSWRMQTEG